MLHHLKQPPAMATPTDTTNDDNKKNRVILRDDGKNFQAWKTFIPVYLQSSPYAWDVVVGDINPLSNADEKKKYDTGNTNAREIIFSTLSQHACVRLFYADSRFITAKDAFDRINDRFQGLDQVYADIAIGKFSAFKFDQAKGLNENLSIFSGILFDLQDSNTMMEDKLICARLVNSLPQNWDSFKSMWGIQQNKNYDTLLGMLTAEDARRRMNRGSQDTMALAARAGNRRPNRGHYRRTQSYSRDRRTRSTQRTTETVCWNCNVKGHMARDCPSKKKQNNQRKPSAHTAQALTTTDHPPQVEGTEVMGEVTFLIDSGASCHIANQRSFFTEYSPLEPTREVRLGDSSTVRAHGRGTIEITVQGIGGRKVK